MEKFFTSSQSAALFPEYVARAVRQGMEMASSLPDIAATVTKIDTLDYRTVQTATASDQKIEDPVAERGHSGDSHQDGRLACDTA